MTNTMAQHEYPSVAEVERLQEASGMVKEPYQGAEVNGILTLDIPLSPHAEAAITAEFAHAQAGVGVPA